MQSKRILLSNADKLKQVNAETLQIKERYKIDMVMRNLSKQTQYSYEHDLNQWFVFILEKQNNRCIRELTDEDITEFLYFCTKEGNNSERIKRRIAAISALYKYMRKKRMIIENPTEFIDRPKNERKRDGYYYGRLSLGGPAGTFCFG